MEYTKGEWKVSNLIEPEGTYPRYYIECPHNSAVATVDARNVNASVDAHLIAAAPDMYEALKHLANEISDFHIETARSAWGNTNVSCMEHAREQARQALAKAEGENHA